MNNIKVFFLAATVFILIVAGWLVLTRPANITTTDSVTPTVTNSPGAPTGQSDITGIQAGTQGSTFVNIYLVALDDNGTSGKEIGCGDSLVAVKREIPKTQGVLTAALNEQLAQKAQYYGESGLYNALANSSLQVAKATILNGVAEVYLTGNLSLGGVCDDPRVEEMLKATTLQFPTVKDAKLYLNNVPLHEALSEK